MKIPYEVKYKSRFYYFTMYLKVYNTSLVVVHEKTQIKFERFLKCKVSTVFPYKNGMSDPASS